MILQKYNDMSAKAKEVYNVALARYKAGKSTDGLGGVATSSSSLSSSSSKRPAEVNGDDEHKEKKKKKEKKSKKE